MALTGKQKRYLRSLAHELKPLFQVGKHGVTEEFNKQIDDYIETRELVKISVLQNCPVDKKEVAEEIANATDSEIAQIIGSTIVLYRQSIENKEIKLP